MVLQKIGQEIIKRAIRMAPYESKMWKGLYGPSGRYPGVSNYKYAARGIQHGLAAGSVIGSLISDSTNPYESGQTQTGNPFKKGNRRFNSTRRRSRNNLKCNCMRKHKRLRWNRWYSRSRFRR